MEEPPEAKSVRKFVIDGANLNALLDELRIKHGVVGCTLGILRDGAIETAASGLLNAATGVDCTADSTFQIGSIGKVFTATLMMQLVDEGRVDLDEPVIKYLTDFAIADPDFTRSITVRQLLNHTSGMDGDFFPADDPEGPSTVSYVRKMALLPNLYPPGHGPMTYCNSGYIVAGRIIEVLTGTTWQNAVMDRICRPLEMPQVYAHPHESLRFRSAMGHVADPADPKRTIVSPVTYLPMSLAAAGAVLTMSAESLLLFAKAHLSDGAYGDGKRLLSVQSARAMRESKIAIPPFTLPGVTHWGLGWWLGEGSDYRMAGHDGGTSGHVSYLRTYPEKGIALTLLANSHAPKFFEDMEKRVMRSLLGTTVPEGPPRQEVKAQPERYIGRYANVAVRYTIAARDGQLNLHYVGPAGGPAIEAVLEPYRADIFTLRSDNPLADGLKILFLSDNDSPQARFVRIGPRMGRREVP
jgi:CubicO group peptidase (beta-lactamase class C family)